MKKFNLSYILATRNRLPFLKITLEKLVSGLLLDEEIVVVDGESNDGSKEYLQALFDEGRIHHLTWKNIAISYFAYNFETIAMYRKIQLLKIK